MRSMRYRIGLIVDIRESFGFYARIQLRRLLHEELSLRLAGRSGATAHRHGHHSYGRYP